MISVIIPVYNRAHLIKRTLDNVFEQTCKDFEVIVVDDASTDDLERVIEEYRLKGVRYIKNPGSCPQGAGFARNLGVKAAQGELMVFQDSDDLWDAEKLELQYKLLKQTNAEICFCGMRIIGEDSRSLKNRDSSDRCPHSLNFSSASITLENELRNNFISPQLLPRHKKCFAEEPFDESFPRFEDWDLGIWLVKKYKCVYLQRVLAQRNLQKDSISLSSVNGCKGIEMLLDKYRDDYALYPKSEAKMLAYNAYLREALGKSSGNLLKRSLKLDFQLWTLIRYILKVFGLYGFMVRRTEKK